MSKNKKMILFIYLIIILLLSIIMFVDYNNKIKSFRCWGQISVTKNINNESLTLEASLSFIRISNEKGIIAIKGVITNESSNPISLINRIITYTRTKQNNNIYALTNDSEHVESDDTTNDDIFHLFMLGHGPIRMFSSVHYNAILVQDTLKPRYLCVQY